MAEYEIEVKHLSKTFEQKGVHVEALSDINLTIEAGDIYGIIGMSGAGKSTLVRCLNYLEKPTDGQVLIEGKDLGTLSEKELRAQRSDIAMIFQHFNLLSSRTVYDNIAFPLEIQGKSRDEIRKKVEPLLDLVGLTDRRDHYPSQLSGGQKQRVGIARALASDPKVLLCDEATSALDPQTTESILELLRDINKRLHITIVMITHQMNVVQQIANRVAVISSGKVVESGSVYDVFAAPRQPVTKRFISTAISGIPEESRINTMHEENLGHIVTVLIRQHDVEEREDGTVIAASGQNISQLIAKHGVRSSLLYGGIDTVNGVAIGAITYEFGGDNVESFLNELAQNSDIVDFGTAAQPTPYEQALIKAGQEQA